MKLTDRNALAECRARGWCGVPTCFWHGVVHAHHIYGKGAGRVDIRENLIPLCPYHHGGAHSGGVFRSDLLEANAKFWGVTPDGITNAVYALRRPSCTDDEANAILRNLRGDALLRGRETGPDGNLPGVPGDNGAGVHPPDVANEEADGFRVRF